MFAEYLNLPAFNSLLATRTLGRAPGFENEVWETIDSTNNRALDLARSGAPEGVVVAARHQSAGKGRLGRRWESPPDAGLYLSVLLRPHGAPSTAPLLSFAAGTAVAKACETLAGLRPGLKWVNDIVTGGRKLGGILAEMTAGTNSFTNEIAVVVGIGLNLRSLAGSGAPPLVAANAVSLEEAVNAPVNANMLAAKLVQCLESEYELLQSNGAAAVLDNWKQYSVTLGRHIKAETAQGGLVGIARDLAADGALIVELASGEHVQLHAGDVTIRNSDGTYA